MSGVLYEETEKLWKIVEKSACAVERAEGNITSYLVTALDPVPLIGGTKGGETIEVSAARLGVWHYVFTLDKVRDRERDRLVALVDARNKGFVRELTGWLLALPLPQVRAKGSAGKRVLTLVDIVDGKVQFLSVARAQDKLIVRLFRLPDVRIFRAYRLA